jgi:2-iminobutanoate/2-iminopropanoate deaminase
MPENCQKTIVTTEKAPKAIGPYSVGVKAGPFVYTAGQLGLDPATNNLAAGGVEAETRQALLNLQAILEAAGTSLNDVVKTTVFLKHLWRIFQIRCAGSIRSAGGCTSQRRGR